MPKDESTDSLFQESTSKQKPVECLGKTFESDEARREYYLNILREKLKDPEFRKIEGFPIGEDEDILALSDPPYYTACPNPFIEDFINYYGKPYDPETDDYHCEPFASDAIGSRHNPIYKAHTYHTKVPWEALIPYLNHYTNNGGIIIDSFAGSGMTAIAAKTANDNFFCSINNDISPAATFIMNNTISHISSFDFKIASENILKAAKEDLSDLWYFKETNGNNNDVAYYVWSEVLLCPNCGNEIIYWEIYKDDPKLDQILCSNCKYLDKRKSFTRCTEKYYDEYTSAYRERIKRIPVAVSFLKGKLRIKKELSVEEKNNVIPKRIGIIPHPATGRLILNKIDEWGILYRKGYHFGIKYVHDFFTIRNWETLSYLWNNVNKYDHKIRSTLLFWITSCLNKLSLLMSYNPDGIGRVMKGNLYIGAIIQEMNPIHLLKISQKDLIRFIDYFNSEKKNNAISLIETSSSTKLRVPNNSVDYSIIDPPFGGVIPFVELNFLWESFLLVYSNEINELTINSVRNINERNYAYNILLCFKEIFRVLKPNRWLTVIFHNSKNNIWNLIQESLGKSGFIIADIRILDRKQGAIKQVTTSNAVKQDLIISAYKPNGGLEERFKLKAGTEEGVWDFIRTHLNQLPVFVESKEGQSEIIAERQNYLLFDRMVAFHVQRGVAVPMSAADFYQGLSQRFDERDNMYFLPEQVNEYDKKRMKVSELMQLQILITDESSAIQWLKQQLLKKPQTFQEIHPQFMKEIGGWSKAETPLELSDLLEQNYLRYDGKGQIPAQIVSWLKKSEDMRKIISEEAKELDNGNLETSSKTLLERAKDRWYIPDPSKQSDLEKLRERSLLKEFEEYKQLKGNKIKVFRIEAMRAGFKKCWQDKDYKTIIDLARKVPESVLQEDAKLLMYYDQALTREGEE